MDSIAPLPLVARRRASLVPNASPSPPPPHQNKNTHPQGVYEKDEVRREDSFRTFEEILQKAVEQRVDMVVSLRCCSWRRFARPDFSRARALATKPRQPKRHKHKHTKRNSQLLGGDLFHEASPPKATVVRAVSLLKRYCLGDAPVALQLLSEGERLGGASVFSVPAPFLRAVGRDGISHSEDDRLLAWPRTNSTSSTSTTLYTRIKQQIKTSNQTTTKTPRKPIKTTQKPNNNTEKRCFASGRCNYLDHDLNVGLPVFTIHGNHDDATGAEYTSAVDVLSAAGLVNYFGKVVRSSFVFVLFGVLVSLSLVFAASRLSSPALFRCARPPSLPPLPSLNWFHARALAPPCHCSVVHLTKTSPPSRLPTQNRKNKKPTTTAPPQKNTNSP